ncbi:hypothetical protein CEP54_001055 [Fusarium duplospermum]|uniref:RING-type domain-containing protein n=1 Tax=Fusarium duplospermum TaxID=1325734 RepID=A0A428R2T6_9HYPO|nr:hypothetical protein CEP54_001055 [Fusarium duplospermum]
METKREPPDAEKQACFHQVVNRFPDICPKFLASLVGSMDYKADKIINYILERENLGDHYPKEKMEVRSTLEEGSVGGGLIQQQRLFTDPNRPAERAGSAAFEMTQTMLAGDFPYVPMKSLVEILSNHKNHMYPTDAISLQQAMASGRVFECEGCFAEHPLNRLIHCDGDHPHLFCPKCCAAAAQTQISQSKHELRCISIENCSAGFSVGERVKYLSTDQIKALDRIAKEAEVEQNGQGVQQRSYQQQ